MHKHERSLPLISILKYVNPYMSLATTNIYSMKRIDVIERIVFCRKQIYL